MKLHYLYVMTTETGITGPDGPVKIGITGNPDARLKQVQTGSPERVYIAHLFLVHNKAIARHLEGLFHGVHKDQRLNGEWFRMGVAEAVARVAIGYIVYLLKEGVRPQDISAAPASAGIHEALERSGMGDADEVIAAIVKRIGP